MSSRAGARRQAAGGAAGIAARIVFAALVAVTLLSAVLGGLLRVGIIVPATAEAPWLTSAGWWHAALMIGAFLGTVIALERAVAVKLRAAFAAPLASLLAGLSILLGRPQPAAWLLVAAGLVFAWVNVVVVRRQAAPHTRLLLLAALAWLAGNLLFAIGAPSAAVLPWWFAFLIMTIAAERLEMTRLMRRRPAAPWLLLAIVGEMVAGAAWSWPSAGAGGLLFGASLVLLAWWLVTFDIARRTVFAAGLSRYMALCLLSGYGWLAVGGIAWMATALGAPWRDVALHALGLGFIFSMIMGHAPVILPAIARVKLRFGWPFYLPLAALHGSLLVRLVWGTFDPAWRGVGAALNAGSILLFALTMIGAVLAWRVLDRAPGAFDRS